MIELYRIDSGVKSAYSYLMKTEFGYYCIFSKNIKEIITGEIYDIDFIETNCKVVQIGEESYQTILDLNPLKNTFLFNFFLNRSGIEF